MRYTPAVRVLTIGALAWSAACSSDAPTAPASPASDFTAAGPALDRGNSGRSARSETEVVTIDPTRSHVYRIGHNWLYVPANVVCVPGSTYGPTEWDEPCARQVDRFQVTVTIGEDADGHPTAHFAPDMRFAPSSNPYRWVVLGLKMRGRLDPAGYGVLYQPTGSTELIDEAATDPTLRAWRERGNVIARRLKHFSGYNVSLGFQEQESQLDMRFRLGEAY